MFRSIFGFAIVAVLAWLGLKIVFGILGGLIGLAMTILWLAALGFLFYLVLRVVSPRTADKIRAMIKGGPAAASSRSDSFSRAAYGAPPYQSQPDWRAQRSSWPGWPCTSFAPV